MLLWTDRRVPLYLLPIPLAWSFIGFWAAVSLGMKEDFGLLAAGLIGSLVIILRDRFSDKNKNHFDPADVAAEATHSPFAN
jgi:uncharacterized membrane protein YhiD involved in acid resistance